MKCQVVYALADRQHVVDLELQAGATVADAVQASGLREQHPEIGADAVLGVFGKVVPGTQRLREGDRVEIYRPLRVDPREARRARTQRRSEATRSARVQSKR